MLEIQNFASYFAASEIWRLLAIPTWRPEPNIIAEYIIRVILQLLRCARKRKKQIVHANDKDDANVLWIVQCSPVCDMQLLQLKPLRVGILLFARSKFEYVPSLKMNSW